MVAAFLRLLLWFYSPFLALVVVLMGTAVYYLVYWGWHFFFCGLYFFPIALLLSWNLWQVLSASRVLFTRLADDDPLEVVLPRKKYQALYAWIQETAGQLRLPAPHEVRLAADTVAAVFEGKNGQPVLVLGGPAVAAFSQAALAGVVAHELAHVAGGDTRLSRRALRQSALMKLLEAQFHRRRWSYLNPLLGCCGPTTWSSSSSRRQTADDRNLPPTALAWRWPARKLRLRP